MRILVQRVSRASVTVDQQLISQIDHGLLILLGVGKDDEENDMDWLCRKLANLRIFGDDDDKMNLSILDVNGSALVISQFTLYASTRKGNRPSFIHSASPDIAESLYERFCKKLSELLPVKKGIFGADMKVELLNDGPVTIWIDSKNRE